MTHENGRIGGPCTPTVYPISNFSPATDVETLFKAMKGLGTNEKNIIDLLTQRSHKQRMEIVTAYQSIKEKNLVKELKSETSGDFRSVLTALVTNKTEYTVTCLYKAMKGSGTSDKTLTDIFVSSEPEELQKLANVYGDLYGKALIDDIKKDTKGEYQDFLITCLKFKRDTLSEEDKNFVVRDSPESVTDWDMADSDAHVVNQCFQEQTRDHKNLVNIICTRSKLQLKALIDTYRKLYGIDLIKQIDRDLSKDLGYALRSMIIAQICKPRFFAEVLFQAMKGLGTREAALIRVVVPRSDIDLECIKQEYTKLYSKSLCADIKSETSGDFGKTILLLCGRS